MSENSGNQVINVQVRRGSGDESYIESYKVPLEHGQSVLGVLQYIYDELDSTLASSCSCRIGLCSVCLVRVNGKAVKACTTIVKGDMLIEPLKDELRIRDLVVQFPFKNQQI